MNHNTTLTTQEIPKLLRQLAIPASTGIFFNTMYNVVDTFYAGLISTQAVAALSLSFMIFFSIIGFGHGFSTAITALVGNWFGKKRYNLASLYAQKGLVFVPLLGVVVTILGIIYSPTIFSLLGAKQEYLADALAYINPILYGSIFFMINFALNAILVAQGDTKSFRNTLIFGFVANLVLNPLFIYGFLFIPPMGIQGIAIATVLIQILNMFYLFFKVNKTNIIKYHRLDYFLPDIRVYKDLLRQGIPASLNMLIMSFGSLILTYFVSHYGMKAVAGYGIGFRVEQIMLLPALGLNTAVLTLVSNNYGAKQYNRVVETIKVAMKYGFIISTFGIIVLTIFGKLIISQFDSNETVVNFGLDYLLIEVWIFYAYIVLFICVSTLQGIKKPKMILYIALYRQIFAKVIVAYIIVKYFELNFGWLWIGIFIVINSAAIFAYFYTNRMLKKYCFKKGK